MQILGYHTIPYHALPSSVSYHAGQSLVNYQNNAFDLAQYEPTTAKGTKQMDIVSHIKLGVLTFLFHHGTVYTTTAILSEKRNRIHSSGFQHTCYREYHYLVGS